MRTVFLFCLTFFFSYAISVAQTFERIETGSGLGILAENNGVAVADIDNDNDLDIFVVAKNKDEDGLEKSFSRLFRNDNNGAFTDITETSGLKNLLNNNEVFENHDGLEGFKFGAYWGDYNNDGLPDIFFTHMYKIQLFKNLGNNKFIEVTEAVGIEKNNECYITSATWTDFNNDGFLDLFINDWGKCLNNIFYKNNGDGSFTRIDIGNENFSATYNMFPFDFNNDGYKDFYLTTDLFGSNLLYVNQKDGSFSEQAIEYNLDTDINDMGITMGDFNLDGALDIFITGLTFNVLLKNDGDNTFTDVTDEYNLSSTNWSWGTRFADFDLDGDEDLFIVNGSISKATFNNAFPNVYYKNLHIEGESSFVDFSSETKLNDISKSMEAIEFDYDNDGDLDMFVSCLDRPSFFYENNIINANDTSTLNWFKIALEGTTSNRSAYGTTVSIKTPLGNLVRYFSGVGMLSQSLAPLHFGLNNATTIEEIKIVWPSGLIEYYKNIQSNVLFKAKEGEGYVIINQLPSPKTAGCTDPNSCNYNSMATINDGSCEYVESKVIEGAVSSEFNKEEHYFYNIADGSEVLWTVEGGQIISGENTNEIIVKWGLEKEGTVTVIEKTTDCQSLPIRLVVDINTIVLNNVSIARIWNEALLEAIRKDYARPTVHARNLFHTSIAMYDAWAILDSNARPYLIGNTIHNFTSKFDDFKSNEDPKISETKAISYAAYRLLSHRFRNSPGYELSQEKFDLIMEQLDYDINFVSQNYQDGNPAALGNFIGQTLMEYGLGDGSREVTDYDNAYYEPVNLPLDLNALAQEDLGVNNPNRWQPLKFNTFIDQSGNIIPGSTPVFLSPEWGNVDPFALNNDEVSNFKRDTNNFQVFHDPGSPPYLNIEESDNASDLYKWNFSLVSIWSSHLDSKDGIIWDISPKSIGNISFESLPKSLNNHAQFYNLLNGGDLSMGYNINPITKRSYETQLVPRADYARVLAEFWADGPDSETPPGHWFTLLNYVSDHPLFSKMFNGKGEVLKPLEWDVKSYFILGGAMHDAAISAWSIKGWYDYIRPISAIRNMCSLGQSSNTDLINFHVGGIPLIKNYIEVVEELDELAGLNGEHIGKIKLYAWKGHDYIEDSNTDVAGVDWILAENWWPYQRPSFVTPPFAGYVSGHSTFSRAAAEVMTLITGDEYFPGGIGEFIAKKNEFLVFEEGPSVDVILQWATYRDASDQCSLSRIWGGIHPPADDVPGRLIGEKIGVDAYNYAIPYFNSHEQISQDKQFLIYPNPSKSNMFYIKHSQSSDEFLLFDIIGRSINIKKEFDNTNTTIITVLNSVANGVYVLKINNISKLIILNK